MKKLLLFLLFSTAGFGQAVNNYPNARIISFAGVPSGACSFTQLGLNASNGDMYDCLLGAWNKISGSGGSPAGAGTEVQYRAGATTFGAITGSSVSGANMTVAGSVTANSFAGAGSDPVINFPSNPTHTPSTGDLWRNVDVLQFRDSTGTRTLASAVNNLSFFASTTSAQFLGIISDEIGSGSKVPKFDSVSGNSGVAAQSSGSLVSGNCAKFDANGNIVDNGAVCGSGGSTAGANLFATASLAGPNNSAVETSLLGGTKTIAANTFLNTQVTHFEVSGYYTTPATLTDNLTIKVKCGSTVIGSGVLTGTVLNNQTVAQSFRVIGDLHPVGSGAGGSLLLNSIIEATAGTLVASEAKIVNTSAVAFDFTTACTFDVTATWAGAQVGELVQAVGSAMIGGAPVTSVNGSTGAVTVSSLGYSLEFFCSQAAPADSTTYYCGSNDRDDASTTSTFMQLQVPKAGTVKAAYVSWYNNSTLATSESVQIYFRLNDTTDTTISTTVNLSTVRAVYTSATGLSTAVVAGDKINIKVITPAWATNPTNQRWMVILYIE